MQLSEHCQGCQEDAGCQGDGSGDTCVSQINESRGTVLPDSLHAMSRAEPSLVTHLSVTRKCHRNRPPDNQRPPDSLDNVLTIAQREPPFSTYIYINSPNF